MSTRAWLELARLSNAPTVLTNTLAGFVLGGLAIAQAGPTPAANPADNVDWTKYALVASVALALYIAGMILNDAKDARRDAESRPERPIPSGRVRGRTAWGVGLSLLVLAVGFAIPAPAVGAVTLGIVVFILLYTWLHADHAWACAFMGACRFGLYPLGAAAALAPSDSAWTAITNPVLIFGGALGVTTILITLAARTEATKAPQTKRVLAWVVVFVPLCAPLLAEPPMIRSGPSLVAAVVFALWGSRCARAAIAGKPWIAIPGWLAGFCLYDAMVLAMFGRPDLALAAGTCFIVTVLAQRVLPGT